MIEIAVPGKAGVSFADLTPAQARALVETRFRPRGWRHRLWQWWTRGVDLLLLDDAAVPPSPTLEPAKRRDPEVLAFFEPQVHIAMEHTAAWTRWIWTNTSPRRLRSLAALPE